MKGDVFGTKGDFVTSPEISQVFGELLALWFVQYYMALKTTPRLSLVELGPGRGTLMLDVLRTLSQFKFVYDRIEAVHLVEASPGLRRMQQETLTPASGDGESRGGFKISWHESLTSVPSDSFTLFVAHEFLDALPVYKFEKTEDGWREILVDFDDDPSTANNFRFVKAPSHTKASISLLSHSETSLDAIGVGSRVELAPDVADVTKQLAERIKTSGGAALIVDYGQNSSASDSLRGIANHSVVNPLSKPGECDLSADVDFSLVASEANGIAFAYGPVTQATFLHRMGIGARMIQLLKSNISVENRKQLASSYERLVSKDQMGDAYKVLAITDSPQTPYGF